jgi:hypothetical protein
MTYIIAHDTPWSHPGHMPARHSTMQTTQTHAVTTHQLGPLAGRLSFTHDSKRQHPTSGAQYADLVSYRSVSNQITIPLTRFSMPNYGISSCCQTLPHTLGSNHALLSSSQIVPDCAQTKPNQTMYPTSMSSQTVWELAHKRALMLRSTPSCIESF